MIKAINLAQQTTSFKAKPEKGSKANDETRILPNTLNTRIQQGFQKTSSAFIDYPVRGLQGDVNSNFYEFLTMGIVPYLAGSAMFMLVFNVVNKFLEAKSRKIASKIGNKMALGVVLYGVLKSLSKDLVTKPVSLATGVDIEMPYQNKVYPLPKGGGEDADVQPQYQQRTVFDSKEFFRKDLLDREYFDKVAKKLGLGENLNDSVTETTPIIQNIVATTNMAKSLSSYSWAAVGVGLAAQDDWCGFFDSISHRKRYVPKEGEEFLSKASNRLKNSGKNLLEITKSFGRSLKGACKSLWNGNPADSAYMRHAGKGLVGFAAVLTTFLTANTIIRAKNMAKNKNVNTIDKHKESTVI